MGSTQDGLQDKGRRERQAEVTDAEQPHARNAVEDDVTCWVCGRPMVERHCKLICQTCGFTRDCSDP